MVRGVVAALLAALGGCTLITDSFLTNDFSGDPFPTRVDTSTGAIVVGIHAVGTAPDNNPDAVLDLLSPITVIDSGPMTTPAVTYADLMVLGNTAPGASTRIPRARFPQAQLVALHPCPDTLDDGTPDPDCKVGTPDLARTFRGIVGADTLAGDDVRLRLGDDQIFVLPDVGGSDRGRTLDCDAVFGSPYRGGGTLELAGTELPFGNRRIALRACLGQDPDPGPMPAASAMLSQHGADALFVVSTSIGISILDESAYARYRVAVPEAGAPDVAALPVGSVYLPSGLVTGHRATLDRLALVGTSISNGLSPCRQIYAHHMLADGPLARLDPEGNSGKNCTELGIADCPCKDGSSFCAVPAVFELTPPSGVDVLVVPDTEPTLQALRAELRPDQPEVDGLLGTDVLRAAEIDVDYPHDRLLARCTGTGCLARPQLTQAHDRCQINHCIYGRTDGVGCP